jgi:hypothetical protein
MTLTETKASVKPSRKPPEPVHGSCRWAHRCSIPGPRVGILDINGTPYAVTLIAGGIELRKSDGTCYHIGTDNPWGWSCDCPDAEFRSARPGGCKHQRACKAALAAIGIELLPAASPIPAARPAVTLEDL